jgi:hypothetical protein
LNTKKSQKKADLQENLYLYRKGLKGTETYGILPNEKQDFLSASDKSIYSGTLCRPGLVPNMQSTVHLSMTVSTFVIHNVRTGHLPDVAKLIPTATLM